MAHPPLHCSSLLKGIAAEANASVIAGLLRPQGLESITPNKWVCNLCFQLTEAARKSKQASHCSVL